MYATAAGPCRTRFLGCRGHPHGSGIRTRRRGGRARGERGERGRWGDSTRKSRGGLARSWRRTRCGVGEPGHWGISLYNRGVHRLRRGGRTRGGLGKRAQWEGLTRTRPTARGRWAGGTRGRLGGRAHPTIHCVRRGKRSLAADGSASAARISAERSNVIPAGAASQISSDARLWLSVNGEWPDIASPSEETVSAALRTALIVSSSTARCTARPTERRAAGRQMRAARRAARLDLRRDARRNMRAGHLAALNLSAAVSGCGDNTHAAAAGPGMSACHQIVPLPHMRPSRSAVARQAPAHDGP